MATKFRIHGDNIVECERVMNIIRREVDIQSLTIGLYSPSTIVYEITANYCGNRYHWLFELLPGFNKAGRTRWSQDIFAILRRNGSFLEETPDAIITEIKDNSEKILFAIEFCSALQAGNQAWQRSGRAFSTYCAGCPYLYVVDFVKYELDQSTRARKALRYPNPVVPFSYIALSRHSECFVAQVYVRAEEFDKERDPSLRNFNEDNFGDKDLAIFILKKLCHMDTINVEKRILEKSNNIVEFLSQTNNSTSGSFTTNDWHNLGTNNHNIFDYSLQQDRFHFQKKVANKSHHGKSKDFINLVSAFGIGVGSKNLPFGVISPSSRLIFANYLSRLYESFGDVIACIGHGNTNLVICIIKGFKPRGDDDRPDRGILPLIKMLDPNAEIMTFIFGPLLNQNAELLTNGQYEELNRSNGFWKTILSLSRYVLIDSPIINEQNSDLELLIDTENLGSYRNISSVRERNTNGFYFEAIPTEYHEDDVDTGIHFLFKHVIGGNSCFEGLCNPPGGDWSGLSILISNASGVQKEIRWLTLPRVSSEVQGKRPDHVIEIFIPNNKPFLLIAESKEKPNDLEINIGDALKGYLSFFSYHFPSVERNINQNWTKGETLININDFNLVSAGAFLYNNDLNYCDIFSSSNCDLLIVLRPVSTQWIIKLVCKTNLSKVLAEFILSTSANNEYVRIEIIDMTTS